MLSLTSLKVSDKVAIGRTAGFYNMETTWSGVYTVDKVGKMAVTLKRDTDGHTRKFSLVTGKEVGNTYSTKAFVASLETFQADVARRDEAMRLTSLLQGLKNATATGNFDEIKVAYENLAEYMEKKNG